MTMKIFERFPKKSDIVLLIIIIMSSTALILNFFNLLSANPTNLYYLLFYIPIILVAYYYPRRGILISAGFAFLFLTMVMVTSHESVEIVINSLGHAGIFIIIGFVASYLAIYFSNEQRIHERLVEIVESSNDAIIGKKIDGTVTDWNKGAETLYGYTADEMIGRSISVLLPADRPDEVQTLLTMIQEGKPVERYETERMAKDGRRIEVSLSISPIKNDRGRIIGASTIAHDITERKRMEGALDEANKKLQLLNSITRHDILNQITALNFYYDTIEEVSCDTVVLSSLRKAKKATETISRQISFTSEYQDIGVKKPEWQNVGKVFLNAAGSFNTGLIRIEPFENVIEVYADPLFERVFYNLIDNSLRYGDKLTRIQCSYLENERGLVLVYEDDGVGISMDDKPKLFNKGFGKNTGLGLFLIREILAITRITIAENGLPGKGVRFEIRIPRGMYRFTGAARISS
jgi:PAS domain S-box-containing protein